MRETDDMADEYVRLIHLPRSFDQGYIDAALAMADYDARDTDPRLRRQSYEVVHAATVDGEPLRITMDDGTEYESPPSLRISYEVSS